MDRCWPEALRGVCTLNEVLHVNLADPDGVPGSGWSDGARGGNGILLGQKLCAPSYPRGKRSGPMATSGPNQAPQRWLLSPDPKHMSYPLGAPAPFGRLLLGVSSAAGPEPRCSIWSRAAE